MYFRNMVGTFLLVLSIIYRLPTDTPVDLYLLVALKLDVRTHIVLFGGN